MPGPSLPVGEFLAQDRDMQGVTNTPQRGNDMPYMIVSTRRLHGSATSEQYNPSEFTNSAVLARQKMAVQFAMAMRLYPDAKRSVTEWNAELTTGTETFYWDIVGVTNIPGQPPKGTESK